jgi:hypothetical protein
MRLTAAGVVTSEGVTAGTFLVPQPEAARVRVEYSGQEAVAVLQALVAVSAPGAAPAVWMRALAVQAGQARRMHLRTLYRTLKTRLLIREDSSLG